MSTTPAVRHDAEHFRFIADTDAGEAILEYMQDGTRIVFTHTGVPEEAESRGIGSALARAGLDYARSHGLRVRPACPFVAGYIKKHPEYQSLVETR